MPRKILQPSPLNLDPNVPVRIRPSFKPELLFPLFAFERRWKSLRRRIFGMRIFHYFDAPIRIAIAPKSLDGMLQPFDSVDMAPVKSSDGVVLNQSNGPDRILVRSNIETEDSVAHTSHYQYCDA